MESDVLVLRSQDFDVPELGPPAQEGADANELTDMVKPEMLKDIQRPNLGPNGSAGSSGVPKKNKNIMRIVEIPGVYLTWNMEYLEKKNVLVFDSYVDDGVCVGSFPFSNLNMGTDFLVKEFRRHSVVEYNRLITESRRGNSWSRCEKWPEWNYIFIKCLRWFVRRRK